MRTTQAGGAAVEVTKLGPGENEHVWPHFLPDGRHFLYMSFGGARPSINLAALDGQEPRRLVDSQDPQGGRDVWLVDVSRGVPTRFTFSGKNTHPVWSPDGGRVAFSAIPSGVYLKESSGVGDTQLLLKSGAPESWSPDGKFLLYSANDAKSKIALWILPMAHPDDNKPTPYLRAPFEERQGQFSPDGRWITYVSDESGQYQVYVRSFPAGAGKFQVSIGGGVQPRWRHGKEIFYLGGDGKLTAVEVKTAPQFEIIGAPKALFDPHIIGPSVANFRYDVTADGKRFLVISASGNEEESAAAPITVVLNWQAELKR